MSDNLVARLQLRGKQDREMPNHYVRRMEIDRLEAAKRIEELEAKLRDTASADFEEAARDAMTYGAGITQGGKRIDPRDYYLAPMEPYQDDRPAPMTPVKDRGVHE